MPELPEVEPTRLGIVPHLIGKTITDVILRHQGLRWPFPANLNEQLCGQKIIAIKRRSKYLLLECTHGVLLIHLGMSGHLCILQIASSAKKHDHFELVCGETRLRLNDPRRFGAVLWHLNEAGAIDEHPLLKKLGLEPLDDEKPLSGKILYQATRKKQTSIKQVLLSNDIVVGVGNIYASESLFRAGISPLTKACEINLKAYQRLAAAVRQVLQEAIDLGGSSLRDFLHVNGQSGYFQQNYFVYARAGQACRICQSEIIKIIQAQRASFYCPRCQR